MVGSTPLASDTKQPDMAIPEVPLPPGLADVRKYGADEVIAMLNRVPLFMNTLDETDGEGGTNVELEALRALAYEGTRAEVAANFREQGNDAARAKLWSDAREFYTKAIVALKGPKQADVEGGEEAEIEVVERDELEEGKKEKNIEEACFVNRALCNLEMKNYRSCNSDCAAALMINPANIKAWFRSSSACLALDKILEAADACSRGLEIDSQNVPLQGLEKRIQSRNDQLAKIVASRVAREQKAAQEKATLNIALKARNIATKTTLVSEKAPEIEDARLKLEDPADPSSTLIVPVLFLYPLQAQTDLVKAFEENHSLLDHLSYILPVPWDEQNEYHIDAVDCYMPTPSGGLVKAGKKLPLRQLLVSGKVVLVDQMLQVFVVPRSKAAAWIETYKKSQAQSV